MQSQQRDTFWGDIRSQNAYKYAKSEQNLLHLLTVLRMNEILHLQFGINRGEPKCL